MQRRWRRRQQRSSTQCRNVKRVYRAAELSQNRTQACLSMRSTSKLSSGNESPGLWNNSQGFEHMSGRVLLETSELPPHLKCIRIRLQKITEALWFLNYLDDDVNVKPTGGEQEFLWRSKDRKDGKISCYRLAALVIVCHSFCSLHQQWQIHHLKFIVVLERSGLGLHADMQIWYVSNPWFWQLRWWLSLAEWSSYN